MIDSQSVKAPQAETRGYDAGKKIVGRKRHIAVDTDGRLLMVNLTTADISDSAGAQAILDGIRKRWPWVKHLFADGAYDRLKLMDKATYLDFVVEIIRRSDDQKGLQTLPRRWVVNRCTMLPSLPLSGVRIERPSRKRQLVEARCGRNASGFVAGESEPPQDLMRHRRPGCELADGGAHGPAWIALCCACMCRSKRQEPAPNICSMPMPVLCRRYGARASGRNAHRR